MVGGKPEIGGRQGEGHTAQPRGYECGTDRTDETAKGEPEVGDQRSEIGHRVTAAATGGGGVGFLEGVRMLGSLGRGADGSVA